MADNKSVVPTVGVILLMHHHHLILGLESVEEGFLCLTFKISSTKHMGGETPAVSL